MPKTQEAITVAGKLFPSGTEVDDIIRYELAQANKPVKVNLDRTAIINGQLYPSGTNVTVPSQEVVDKGYREAEKGVVRRKLEQNGLDHQTILGSTNDAVAIMILMMSRLALAIRDSTDFDDLKNKVGQSDLAIYGEQANAGLQAGTIKIPALVKGDMAEIVNEIFQKMSDTAKVLEDS